MRRLSNSLKTLVAALALIGLFAIPALPQSIDGCEDGFTIIHRNGRVENCDLVGADDTWCYYTCS